MKILLCLAVLSAIAVNLVSSYPSNRNPSSSEEDSLDETVVVPLEAQRGAQQQQGGSAHIVIGGFGPPLDFGAPLVGGFGPQSFNEAAPYGYPGLIPQPPAPSFFSAFNPFSAGPDPALGAGNNGFLGGLESGLALMRRQLAALLNHVPGVGPAGVPQDGNSTSTTKVIDGHRITINETVYGNGYDGSVFKVRVVDVQPAVSSEEGTTTSPKDEAEDMGKQIDSSETTTQDTNSSGDAEELENEDSQESAEKISNDITQKSDEIEETETKTTPSLEEEVIHPSSTVKIGNVRENSEAIRSDETASTQKPQPESFENEFEQFQRDPEQIISELTRPETWESFEHLHGPEYDDLLASNDVQLHDIPEVPVDLTNDIVVNDILASSGATHNPNSEIIEMFGDQTVEQDLGESNTRRLRPMSLI